ncbi:Hint domain-containing protein [Gymnodinialimonas ceratoperidinii]|uniref:Hint domain-containing protein n=1 Tax=Gymnodinialimonas ceratoperidinii TaxID=2856823 RepID=A0A8F6TV71_9RHOB|nr:Hint domain-containing protein [Gymnodinialimonas ceratoperidinii]QXT38478.1 Hint domain-containing protein [Gymnodinialimonas ceratoperidinii]
MSYSTVNHIFIGNFAIMDNDESDWDTDNADAVKGTYDVNDMELISVTQFDAGDDGVLYDDEGGTGDSISYTTSQGSYSGPVDTSILYDTVITEKDGSRTSMEVIVKQMPNGDTFIVDWEDRGSLDNMQITKIELKAPATTNYVGAYTTYSVDNTSVCFASGTLIDTPRGPIRIEFLRPGDLVDTADNGPQILRWIGGQMLATPGRHAPIVISQGALGGGLPTQPLSVSPQHRILVRSPIVQRMFDTDEVLLPAKRLLDHPGISQGAADSPVCYWHMLFDRHEVVRAHGIWAESLFLGPEAVKSIGEDAIAEITDIFAVDSLDALIELTGQTARPVPEPARQKRLVARQTTNLRAWQSPRLAGQAAPSRERG